MSKYVAESITMIAGRFGHEGLCQLRTELKKKVCVPLGVKPVFRPKKTLKRELMQVKNRTPEQKQTGVVYEIPCKDLPRGVRGRNQEDTESQAE